MQAFFLGERIVMGADGEPARRHAEAAGNDGGDTIEGAIDGGARRDRVADAFKATQVPA